MLQRFGAERDQTVLSLLQGIRGSRWFALSVQLAADHDMLLIRPKSRLTAEQRHAILSYKETLKILLRCCDEGVQARRVVMKQRFDTAADPMVVPSLLFRCDVPDVAGVCFSCADRLRTLLALFVGVAFGVPSATRSGIRYRFRRGSRGVLT